MKPWKLRILATLAQGAYESPEVNCRPIYNYDNYLIVDEKTIALLLMHYTNNKYMSVLS